MIVSDGFGFWPVYDQLDPKMTKDSQFPWGEADKTFNHQTLRDNVALLDDRLLKEINVLAAAGRAEFKNRENGQQSDPLAQQRQTRCGIGPPGLDRGRSRPVDPRL